MSERVHVTEKGPGLCKLQTSFAQKDCGNSGAPSLSSIPYSVIRVEIEQRPSNSSSPPWLFCVDFLSLVWGPWHPYLDKTM
jgi:hypothetical protein